MPLKYRNDLKQSSRILRHNMTDAERALWLRIRNKQIKGCQFYRQKPIGRYIVDFYCPKPKLVLEIDGSQHYESENKEKDKTKSQYLESEGLKILRFTDLDVLKNIDGAVERICNEIK